MFCVLSRLSSSRDACEASANRRLSGQQLECVLARQRQLEGSAEADRKRLEKVSKTTMSF